MNTNYIVPQQPTSEETGQSYHEGLPSGRESNVTVDSTSSEPENVVASVDPHSVELSTPTPSLSAKFQRPAVPPRNKIPPTTVAVQTTPSFTSPLQSYDQLAAILPGHADALLAAHEYEARNSLHHAGVISSQSSSSLAPSPLANPTVNASSDTSSDPSSYSTAASRHGDSSNISEDYFTFT
ncbi:hypothetical protein EB796_006532 [Bugula neritina]|uniref:Uncharacterized protein n=1 Tax=Bugula neritina TaxID=10212 RepID=A0A7J7KC34_BUGNE|nr:hypothetical protein EB796_006532 [Bugula neritina]